MSANRTALAALAITLAAAILYQGRPYNCETDTECEAEEAARCLILCQR